jgi:hypothetical protein
VILDFIAYFNDTMAKPFKWTYKALVVSPFKVVNDPVRVELINLQSEGREIFFFF